MEPLLEDAYGGNGELWPDGSKTVPTETVPGTSTEMDHVGISSHWNGKGHIPRGLHLSHGNNGT